MLSNYLTLALRNLRKNSLYSGLNIAGLAIGGISHSAHFGGLLGGVTISLLLPPSDRQPGRRRLTPTIGLVAVLIYGLTLAGFGRWLFGEEGLQFGAVIATDYTQHCLSRVPVLQIKRA